MFKLNLKIALRNLWKNKGYTLINVLGLSIGLAVFCVIMLFVNYELSYDRFDGALDKSYRLGFSSGDKKVDYFPYLDAELIKANEANINSFTRIESPRNDQQVLVEANNQSFYLDKILKTDANFFEFFPFRLLIGDKSRVFSKVNSIVLTKAVSKRVFGDKDPVGQVIKTKDIFKQTTVYTVTGVMNDQSDPSHLDMNACVYKAKQDFEKTEGYQIYNIYFSLKNNADAPGTEKRITKIIEGKWLKNASPAQSRPGTTGNGAFLESVPSIHLHPKIDVGSNLQMITILGVLAVLILLLVCINFTNLLVARSFKRAREIGIRKVLGAQIPAIISQFIFEVVLQVGLAFLLGLVLMEFIFPLFNNMLDMKLNLWSGHAISTILTYMAFLLVFTTIITGAYPAWYLSRFQPAKVLKGDISRSKFGNVLRSGLLILQFSISVLFLCGMLLVNRQVKFIMDRETGFDAEQVVAVKAQTTPTAYENYAGLKHRLEATPGVALVSKTTFLPGSMLPISLPLRYKGNTVQTKKIAAEIDYFNVMKIPVVAGRVYNGKFVTDTTDGIVLNESAVKALGLKDPIGQTVEFIDNNYDKFTRRKVLGVVRDINMEGFETHVAPAFYVTDLLSGGGWQNNILIRIKPGNIQQTLNEIKEVWKQFEPDYPIDYVFVDEVFSRSYQKYVRLSQLFNAFTFLSILISSIGLLALISLITTQRTKEIAIRKILGASDQNIIVMLNRSVLRLVLIGNVIALPVIYILIKKWLNVFAYRMEMSLWPYLIALVASVIIAVLTVTLQSLKAAMANPVNSLKYD